MSKRNPHMQIARQLLKEVKHFYGNNLVTFAIFGSVARGRQHPLSDIDCIIVSKNLPRGRMQRINEFIENVEQKLEDKLIELQKHGYFIEISPIIKTPEEVKFGGFIYLDMIENVKILYDRNNFFKNYLKELKTKLKKMGAKKIPFMGGYYWVLKEGVKPREGVDI